MTPRRAWLRAALVGLPLALALPLSGCAGKPADPADARSASGSSAPSSASGSPAPGTEQRIEVTFAHGRAGGDTGRVQVATGAAVTLVVTSDAADEVHVHGYDVEKELSPSSSGTSSA